jgi:hypothetical protein
LQRSHNPRDRVAFLSLSVHLLTSSREVLETFPQKLFSERRCCLCNAHREGFHILRRWLHSIYLPEMLKRAVQGGPERKLQVNYYEV